MCRATIYDARNNFSSLVKIAEGGEPVELTRHDKPVAVIICYEEFQAQKPKENFLDKLEKLKKNMLMRQMTRDFWMICKKNILMPNI